MQYKFLVTGGAGFIGSNVVQRLVKEGAYVRVLDNLSTGNLNNLSSVIKKIEFIEGDIRDLASIQRVMQGIDYVLHQAALPSVPRSIEAPLQSHECNLTGTLNTLIASRDNRIKRFVFASSSSIYGDTPILPKTEEMSPSPLSPYALTKVAGEYYCRIFYSVFGLQTISLRYFNVFGPHQNPYSEYAAVIPKFISAMLLDKAPVIFGDGEQTRDFTFIDNVVAANILATRAKKTEGEAVNVASGFRTSLNQLLDQLRDITHNNVSPKFTFARAGDVRHSVADISKAQQILDYKPEIDLNEGLQQTVAWFSRRV